MSRQNKPSLWSSFMTNNWSILISLVSFFVIGIICSLAFLLLEDHYNEFMNAKSLSPTQLKKLNERAEAHIFAAQQEANWDKVVDGIHMRTGFHADPNLQVMISACTSCHSAKLVTQNRATRDGWENMIRWMQETQGLPDLGDQEPLILDYLAKYYAPKEVGRRANLDLAEVEWYILELE